MSKPHLIFLIGAGLALAPLAPAAPRTPGEPTPLLTKRSVEQLVAVLKSDAPLKDKADACRELGVIGTKDTIPVLAALLPDEQLNHAARYALEPNPDPAAGDALREALGKTRGRPLVGVIHSVGVRRDAKATDALAKLLSDADPDVAQAAARALGRIGTQAAARAIESALAAAPAANKLAFYEGLFRCAEVLATAGQQPEAHAIYNRLRSVTEPHQVRAGAVRGAILTGGANGPRLLGESLRSDDWIVVAAAARAAMEMKGPEATSVLVDELNRGSADKRVLVAQVLGRRADPTAVPALLAIARTGDKTVRLAALRALPQIGHSDAVKPLLAFFDDTDKDVAQAAQDALAGLPGAEADAAVLALLNAPEAARRVTALDLIARRRMTGALPAVAKATSDADATVRAAALKRLGDLAGPNDLPLLAGRLLSARSGPEAEAAEQALTSLATRAGDAEATAATLSGLIAQARPESKAALLRVLSAVGGKTALTAVREAVKDANPEVRNAAIRALGDWKTAEAAPDLLALARTAEPKDRLLLLRSYFGLARNADFPVEQRLEMCRQAASTAQSQDEKRLLLSALGSVPSADALPLIVQHFYDATTKEEASAAVVSIAERLLRGRENARVAARLVTPLEQAARATTNADLARRAQAALQQARSRSGNR